MSSSDDESSIITLDRRDCNINQSVDVTNDITLSEGSMVHLRIKRIETVSYRLNLIDSVFWTEVENSNKYIIIALSLFFFVSSAAASTPYLIYGFDVPGVIWILLCVIRSLIYFTVFSGYSLYWSCISAHLSTPYISLSQRISGLFVARVLVSCLFSVTYALMYSVKWYEMDSAIIRDVTVPLFFIMWLSVFYTVIDKHLSFNVNIDGLSTSSVQSRKRASLLSSIKVMEKYINSSQENCKTIFNQIKTNPTLSLLFASVSSKGFGNEEERLSQYEEVSYDNCLNFRTNIVNVFLGVCIIPLTLSLMEDYGHSFALVLKNGNQTNPLPISEDSFLWLISWLSSTLSFLYIIATYPIPHKYARKRCTMPKLSTLSAFVVNVPFMFCAAVLASVRINSSYSIFGKMAARFQIPYNLGLPLIWLGVMIVFCVDYLASMKIISCAFKKHMTLISKALCLCTNFANTNKHLMAYQLRMYTKNIKTIVRNCDEDTLDDLFAELL